jgi:methyltransferase
MVSVAPPTLPVPLVPLGVVLALLVGQRVAELAISARNVRRLRSRGAREYGRGHFPWLVLLHVLFLTGLAAEVLWLGARPGRFWPLWLGLWIGAQALRLSAIHALGDSWNVGIWVVPGAPLVRRGPYRWLRHPNYLAVVVELLAAPLLLGAWRTALAVSILDLAVLRVRIRAEVAALASAALPVGDALASGSPPRGIAVSRR